MKIKIGIFKVNKGFVKYILKYGKIYIFCELLYALCAIPTNYLSVMAPKIFLDSTFVNHSIKNALAWIAAMLVCKMVYSLISSLISEYRKYICSNATLEVKKQLLYKLNYIKILYFDDPVNYDRLSQAFSYSEQAGLEFINCVFGLFSYFASFATVTYVSYQYEWWIVLLFVAMSIVNFAIGIFTRNKSYKYQKERTIKTRILNYFNSIVLQKNVMAEIKLDNAMDFFYEKIKKAFKDYKKTEFKQESHIMIFNLAQTIPFFLFQFISYVYLGNKIISENLTVGDYTLFFTMYSTVNLIATGVISCFVSIYQLNLNSKLILDFYDDVEKYKETPKLNNGMSLIENLQIESIEFCNVCFRYPGQNFDALHNVSFKINRGERISVVGYNGAGKTTLAMLMMSLYQPISGDILINGKSYKEYDLSSYRKRLGVVMQSFNIYSMTILENILLSEEVSDEAKFTGLKALKKVGLENKVDMYPDGVFSNLTRSFFENGIDLSLGEKQKIAIARSLKKDVDAYIMDEPSSSLDPVTEDDLYNCIEEINYGKMMLIVSHRLSSVMLSDKVLFLRNGEIVCFGNHYEMMKMCDEYRNLFNLQAKRYNQSADMKSDCVELEKYQINNF